MSHQLLFVRIAFITTFLSACISGGGGGDSQTPTSTAIEFNLTPSNYTSTDYRYSTTLKGSFSDGRKVEAEYLVKAGGETTFNSESVKSFDSNMTMRLTATGQSTASGGKSYYTVTPSGYRFVGGSLDFDGTSWYLANPSVVPFKSKIGDFGSIGVYQFTDGKTAATTWALKDGFNGKAVIEQTVTMRSSSNTLMATTIDRRTINEAGNILKFEQITTYHSQGNMTLTLSN